MTTKQAQCLLAYLGYDPGGIDGVDGQKTRQAIRNFQGAEGLGVDGVAGEQTAIRLKDAVWQDRFAKDNIVPSSGQPPDLPGWWGKYKWFAPSEFRCPCGKCGGGIAKMHEGIVAEANAMREYLGVPIIIVPPDGHSGGSGYRCQAYNDSLPGSVKNSRHVQGKAVDIITRGVPDEKVEERLAQRKAAGKLRYWYRIGPGAHHMDIE